MTAFFTSFAIFGGIALLASTPALILAQQRRLVDTRRRFWMAIGAVGVFCGVIGVSTDKLERRCVDSGSPTYDCHDFGADGFLLMIAIVFVLIALGKAISIYRY